MGRADAVCSSQMNLVGLVPIEGDFFPGRVSHSCSHAAGTCTHGQIECKHALSHAAVRVCTDIRTHVCAHMYNTCIRMYVLTYVRIFTPFHYY